MIFDPDVYPLDWALVDGRVSEEFYKENTGWIMNVFSSPQFNRD